MPFDNERTTKTKRQTISDRLKESLKNARSFKKKQELESVRQQKKEKQSQEGGKSGPAFGLDDSASRHVDLNPDVEIDRQRMSDYSSQLGNSHHARATDQDEALVKTQRTVERRVEVETTVTVTHKRPVREIPAPVGNDLAESVPKPKEEFAVVVSSRDVAILEQTMPKFHRVKDLPGYMLQGIRMLGRSVFRSFASYDVMESLCREAGVDPLGQIKMMSTMTHHSPSDVRDMKMVASWIMKNGTIVDTRQIDFGVSHRVFRGYMPQVVLSVVDDVTYVLVKEEASMGGPMGEQYYIYVYSGGHVPNLIDAGDQYSYETRKLLR